MSCCADRQRGRSGWIVGAALAGALGGCGPTHHAQKVQPAVVRDVPQVLKGTVGAESSFRGIEPVLVSGLGIVVGLSGTGGSDNLDQAVQATMERELAMRGVGKGGKIQNFEGFQGITPSEFLRSKDVAVVIVEARIPPGAPKESKFDVYVRALPGSSVTSLEGGNLWTTDLRIGPAAVFSAIKTRRLGEAYGPIFINPFSGPSVGPGGEVKVTRTTGRILGGGKVTDPLKIEIAMDNDSFSRSRSVQGSINSRFPREPGAEGPTAHGRGSGGGKAGYQSIELRVPPSYGEKPEEFLQLVRHLRVDPSMPEEYARQDAESMRAMPALAEDLRWCMQSLGGSSLPFLAPLYEYPELAPRMAALEAGAGLGDARAVGPLIDLAKRAPAAVRVQAMRLLGDMPPNPQINLALRELVLDPVLEVRVGAYEALRKRHDPTIQQIAIGDAPDRLKFVLEVLPGGEPMVYVTQQGEPRIVLFGGPWPAERGAGKYGGIRVSKPVFASLWNNQLMFNAEATGELQVRYTDLRSGRTSTLKAPESLAELVEFLGHTPTPEEPRPGLGLTYSQVVGVLYELCPRAPRAGETPKMAAVAAVFATEEDRLKAEIYEAMQTTALADRPETQQDALKQADVIFAPTAPAAILGTGTGTASGGAEEDFKARIVPLKKPAAK